MSSYGVPNRKGPVLALTANGRAVALEDVGAAFRRSQTPLAVDLFCGAGGMSLGLERAGFEVVLGVDHYTQAIETHGSHFGGCSLLADLSKSEVLSAIADALDGLKISLLAGGPPCQPFSRAGRSKIRSLIAGGAWEDDDRSDLWTSFAYLAEVLKPDSILLENVPDFGLGSQSIGFRLLVETLEEEGYSVAASLLSSSDFGVPQHRQRLFITGLLKGKFEWPSEGGTTVTVRDAISDLPPVVEGSSAAKIRYLGPQNEYQHGMRDGVAKENAKIVFDHFARHVRKDDLEAFRLMTEDTLYTDLPAHLQRYRADIFKDKYKRLSWDQPSRTITAHLAKDGYWYIHPEQHRTLTVREAARLQSFPDWFRFAGSPSHAYRQIGEAVPPLLAQKIGEKVLKAIGRSRFGRISQERACNIEQNLRPFEVLREWFLQLNIDDVSAPWRRSDFLWHQLLGLVLFERIPKKVVDAYWLAYAGRWQEPEDFLDDEMRLHALRALGREGLSETLEAIACAMIDDRELVETDKFPGISIERVDLAKALCGLADRRPPTAGTIRVAERFFAESSAGSKAVGEILIGRLVGSDSSGHVYGGLLELAEKLCRPTRPQCVACPLRRGCSFAGRKGFQELEESSLFENQGLRS